MESWIIALFDGIGALGMLGAYFYALKNYRISRETSDYWLVFSIAAFLGFLWAAMVTLEWANFYPVLLDDVQQSVMAASATAFAISAILTISSLVKPTK